MFNYFNTLDRFKTLQISFPPLNIALLYPRCIIHIVGCSLANIYVWVIILITAVHFIRQNRLVREGKRKEPLEGHQGSIILCKMYVHVSFVFS